MIIAYDLFLLVVTLSVRRMTKHTKDVASTWEAYDRTDPTYRVGIIRCPTYICQDLQHIVSALQFDRRGWTVAVDEVDATQLVDDDNTFEALSQSNVNYRICTISLLRDYLDHRSLTSLRSTLIHELVHPIIAGMDHVLLHQVLPLVPKKATRKSIVQAYDTQLEQTVGWFEAVLYDLLFLPKTKRKQPK